MKISNGVFLALALSLATTACEETVDVDAGGLADAGTDGGLPPLPECGDDSPLALAQCVDEARYVADLEVVAMEREPTTAHWMLVQDRCASTLEGLGFEVERHMYGTGVNVVGTLAGTTEPDRRVAIGAHYDHIAGCDGADDNASGVAGVLEAARVLARRTYPRTLVVGCWDEEERGLIGSTEWVAREAAAGRDVEIYFNYDGIAYFDDAPNTQTLPTGFDLLFPRPVARIEANERRGDFIAIIGDELASDWIDSLSGYGVRLGLATAPLEVSQSLKDEPTIGDLRRSDHSPFWSEDWPAVFLTDTANFRYDGYHCFGGNTDAVARLDTDRASRVVAITVASAAEALGLE